MEILTFDQAISHSGEKEKRHILLGNGFSIACRPDIFYYGKLYEKADFSKVSPTAKNAFEALGTQDFEKVIKALRDTKKILESYGEISPAYLKTLQSDADGLRELLVETISRIHPAWPGEINESEYLACRKFINHFDTVYSFNYDLLLYWAQMHTEEGVAPWSDDGFRKSEDDYEAGYVVWDSNNSHEQNTWFLHGALHVFDAKFEVQKYTWLNTGVRLIDQIRDALKRDIYPLFVAEGTSKEKLERIKHSDYLAKAYRSFSSIAGSLFIYGHSLAENDEHYLKRIERGRIKKVYVGIYGDVKSAANKKIIRRANLLSSNRHYGKLDVFFFDAATAKVWGK